MGPINFTSGNKRKENFNYRIFFILAIPLLVTGITLAITIGFAYGIGLIGGGISFFVFGLVHRSESK